MTPNVDNKFRDCGHVHMAVQYRHKYVRFKEVYMGITSGIEPEVDYPVLQTFCHHGWMGDSTCKRIFLVQATCLYFIASSTKLENTETALPNPLVKHFPVLVCINVLNSVPKTVTYRQESYPANMEKIF